MIGIIILNYNNSEDTIACFLSVEKCNTYPCKYVFIDNGSSDKSVDELNAYFNKNMSENYIKLNKGKVLGLINAPKVSLIVNDNNVGYAQGNNIGCRYFEKDSDIDYILVLNNDILFIEDILPTMVRFLKEHKEAAIVSPVLMKKDGIEYDFNCARENVSIKDLFKLYFPYFSKLRIGKTYDSNKHKVLLSNPSLLNRDYFEIELPSGSCMLIDKSFFYKIDYFDPNTFLYYEENILHEKISRLGLKNYLLPQLKCIHLGASTMSQTKFTYSQMVRKASSAFYYGINYSGMNTMEKIFFRLVYLLFVIKLKISLWMK